MRHHDKELPVLNAPLNSDSHPYLAKVVAEQLCKDSEADLVSTEEGFWRYNGQVWEHLGPKTIRNAITELDGYPVLISQDPKSGEMKCRSLKMNNGVIEGVAAVLDILYGHKYVGFFKAVPIGLQFKNGFLTIDDKGELELRPSSPKWRQRVLMDWDWEPKAYAPRWEETLEQWFQVNPILVEGFEFDPHDDAIQKRMFLQEFAGACLMGCATSYAKTAILLGGGQNGKSKFIEALQAAFPPTAWSAINPQSLGDEYRAAMLAGKRINFAADIPSTKIVSSHVFKAAVTGDVITARQIRQQPFQFKPEAGHVFSANALPGTRDHSAGFWRRFVVIEFANRFEGDQLDPHLGDKLAAEKSAIVAWMVRGAQRLLKNGQYTIPHSSKAHLQAWRQDADIVARWLDERTFAAKEVSDLTGGQKLWHAFDAWRQDNRYSTMSSRTFYQRLQNLIGKPKKRKGLKTYPRALR